MRIFYFIPCKATAIIAAIFALFDSKTKLEKIELFFLETKAFHL
jgi:hypothetical protein